MLYLETFRKFRLNESVEPEDNTSLVAKDEGDPLPTRYKGEDDVLESAKAKPGLVVFSVSNDMLDSILHKHFTNKVDYHDEYYTLPVKDFDRFQDEASNKGFNIDKEDPHADVTVIEDLMTEMSSSGGAGAYQTPNAFGNVSDDTVEMLGFEKVKAPKKNVKESQFSKMSKEMFLSEIAYSAYKKDPIGTPKQKINHSINFINRGLKEIEKVVNQNVRLKQEMGVDNGVYWKSSRENLAKISERLLRVSKQLKELAS